MNYNNLLILPLSKFFSLNYFYLNLFLQYFLQDLSQRIGNIWVYFTAEIIVGHFDVVHYVIYIDKKCRGCAPSTCIDTSFESVFVNMKWVAAVTRSGWSVIFLPDFKLFFCLDQGDPIFFWSDLFWTFLFGSE